MFDDLKARPSGFTAREKTKLIVMVSGAAVLGCLLIGLRGCGQEPTAVIGRTPPPKTPPPKERDLDLGRLPVRTTGVPLDAFDKESLEYVIGEIRKGGLKREPALRLTPSGVVALDPKVAAGTTVEVAGRLLSLDHEAYVASRADIDQLWAFGLEGEDGKQVVVVHPGSTQSANGGAPVDAYHPGAGSPPLKSGDFVRVRGVYLQQRTGTIAATALSGPTPVLVGKEYRRTTGAPPPASLEAVDWESVHDRSYEETRSTDEDAHFQVLSWAQSLGHDKVLSILQSKEIKVEWWNRDMFLKWSKEMEGDKDQSLPDPRVVTNAARGKVFVTTGALVDFSKEDWDSVPNNVGDVGQRWKVWIISNYYHNAGIRFDSPFPLTDFPGIFPPPDKGDRRQRVRVFGVFYKNYSFTPNVVNMRVIPEGMPTEVTLPCFILLHLEPDAPIVGLPWYQNPFFWTWVSLAVFGCAFFFVMHKIEKREAGQFRDQNLRIRRRQRELEAARAQGTAGPESPPPEGADPAAGPAGSTTPPPDAPSP